MADFVRRISDIPYDERLDVTVNLYLPMEEGAFPLVILFSDCAFGGAGKEELDPLGRELAGNGIAAALADVRPLEEVTYHTALEDGAKAVIHLLRSLPGLGQVEGVWLGGIGSGASVAMMLAFDKDRLRRRGADPDHLAGYIFADGVCSTPLPVLEEKGTDPCRFTVDADAPLSHLPKEGPPILILTAEEGAQGARQESDLLAYLLRRADYENEVLYRQFATDSRGLVTGSGCDMSPFARAAAAFIKEEHHAFSH